MKSPHLLYEIKELDKKITMFLIKNNDICHEFPPPTPTQIQIVKYIIKNNHKEIYQKDLEKNLNITKATLSGVLNTMEKNGILKRITNESDARSKKIVLKEDFKNVFIKNKKKLSETEKILIKNINNDELEIFTKILNKIKENVNNELKEKDDLHAKII